MRTVYLLTLRQLAGRWRLVIMAVLATLPALVAALMLDADAPSVAEFEKVVLSTMLALIDTPDVPVTRPAMTPPTERTKS